MSDAAILTPAERAALNAALLATGAETGFLHDIGWPAPGPTSRPGHPRPGNPRPGPMPVSTREPSLRPLLTGFGGAIDQSLGDVAQLAVGVL